MNLPAPKNIKHNFAIVDALTAIAQRKNVTSAQLSIAWVGSLGTHVIVSTSPGMVPGF
jgi:pyridoxine 4-dehydrogenase